MMSYFLVTLFDSENTSITITYGIILLGMLVQVLSIDDNIILIIVNSESFSIQAILTVGLYLFPPYNYVISFYSFSQILEFDDINSNSVFKRQQMNDFNIFERLQVKGFSLPSTFESLLQSVLSIIVYSLLIFYFDNLFENNCGKSNPFYFPFLPRFWYSSNNKDNKVDHLKEYKKVLKQSINLNVDKSVELEKVKVDDFVDSIVDNNMAQNIKSYDGVNIIGISKIYKARKWLFCSKEKYALKPLFLQAKNKEVITILGHNGAGKTSLINILTQNASTTSGGAIIFDKDINFDEVKYTVGLCPQYDILWDELTVKDHIKIYIDILKIPYTKANENRLLNYFLEKVNLKVKKNSKISELSGGMKRRLSILLASISKPKIIILDEPTTGLDPINKRFVWELIFKQRENCSILLTTHDMDEAEYLSDRVAILKQGSLMCIGEVQELKKAYGSGYLLTFVAKESDDTEQIICLIKNILPSGKLLASEGGKILMNLEYEKEEELKYFFSLQNILNKSKESRKESIDQLSKLVNNQNEEIIKLSDLLDECGFDDTKLEEIYYKVNRNN